MPDMNELDDLTIAAYHGERVAARKLAARTALSETDALRRTLENVAGTRGLAALLAERRQLRQLDSERRRVKMQARADKLALKQAGPPVPAGAWRGWFDGSAHPNPGRIGIGALLTGPDGQSVAISRRLGYGNSGEAEYGALIALLEAALAAKAGQLVVYGDSQVVIDDVHKDLQQATGNGATGLASQRQRVASLMAQLGKVTLHWIPRHKNGAADRLSQQAAALWRDAEP
ncbi:ribonuclease HI family protein [Janthinobacterium agaricidamnosum]|uniref:RNase H family protein n=1 Tax=Janthinobacterium agaricidamnosum NBRC 102515 = DSM 9628 TaxID=1349767 RepID=W0V5K1_9BURK|nr:ribonuclease HI family protein [Janthinobacterium agaricidamnosum]CDG82628.1 RNase H family protein [Janthinobacterium agaricidamnosum NBRC 102515 = DSM 9628]